MRRRFCFAETGRTRKERRSGVDLLARLDSKQEKRLDRSIRYEYDEFDRVAKIDYGRGEIETFRYDSWGKLVEKTQNGKKRSSGTTISAGSRRSTRRGFRPSTVTTPGGIGRRA